VTLHVNAVNDRPTATADRYSTGEDKPLNVSAPGLLANDSDIDRDLLAAKLVAGPAHGRVTMNADGSFEYVPDRDYNGSDSFSYHAKDGHLASDEATVTIEVAAVDDPPAGTGPAWTPPGWAAPAEAAITRLRLRPRCVRPSRSGKARVQARLRRTRPAPVQVRIDRVVGTKLGPGCRSAKPGRRFRKAATPAERRRPPARAEAAAGPGPIPDLRPRPPGRKPALESSPGLFARTRLTTRRPRSTGTSGAFPTAPCRLSRGPTPAAASSMTKQAMNYLLGQMQQLGYLTSFVREAHQRPDATARRPRQPA
jgi:VCBS repeat-containing protein